MPRPYVALLLACVAVLRAPKTSVAASTRGPFKPEPNTTALFEELAEALDAIAVETYAMMNATNSSRTNSTTTGSKNATGALLSEQVGSFSAPFSATPGAKHAGVEFAKHADNTPGAPVYASLASNGTHAGVEAPPAADDATASCGRWFWALPGESCDRACSSIGRACDQALLQTVRGLSCETPEGAAKKECAGEDLRALWADLSPILECAGAQSARAPVPDAPNKDHDWREGLDFAGFLDIADTSPVDDMSTFVKPVSAAAMASPWLPAFDEGGNGKMYVVFDPWRSGAQCSAAPLDGNRFVRLCPCFSVTPAPTSPPTLAPTPSPTPSPTTPQPTPAPTMSLSITCGSKVEVAWTQAFVHASCLDPSGVPMALLCDGEISADRREPKDSPLHDVVVTCRGSLVYSGPYSGT